MIVAYADDATGALEVGAKFAISGVQTTIWFGAPSAELMKGRAAVIDTETRHLAAKDAYARIRSLIAGESPHIFKKTDSTLRGNIAAEFRALLDVCPDRPLVYAPAYPEHGRTVRGGELFVNGSALKDSPFARDPLNPVCDGYIPAMLGDCGVPVEVIGAPWKLDWPRRAVYVCDSSTDTDLEAIAAALHRCGRPCIAAGAGAFAAHWIRSLRAGFRPGRPAEGRWLVVNGSLHPASRNQMQAACRWPLLSAPEERRGNPTEVAWVLAESVRSAMEAGGFDGIVVFGGATLFAILRALDIDRVEAVDELLPGVPLSRARWQNRDLLVISKAGGFGAPDILDAIRRKLDT